MADLFAVCIFNDVHENRRFFVIKHISVQLIEIETGRRMQFCEIDHNVSVNWLFSYATVWSEVLNCWAIAADNTCETRTFDSGIL